MDIEQLQALKKQLPRGWFKLIVEKVGCSKQTITDIFKGKSNNVELIDKVISEAIKIKDRHEEQKQALAMKIQSAIKK